MDGILSIIKPSGISSHDVVNWARRVYNTRKIGHAGTLDPGAAGILVLAIGKATRLIPYIQGKVKTYRAELSLGFTTDSLDLFSPISLKKQITILTDDEWQNILSSFVGETEQIPPMTSAIKINGKALYKLAREGKTVERPSRKITIYSCKLISYNRITQKLLFDVSCSAGTYIRTLCADIALKAGTVGCMSYLLRTAVGKFNLNNSRIMTNEQTELLPLLYAVADWPYEVCNEETLQNIKTGKVITLKTNNNTQHIAFLNEQKELVALGKRVLSTKYHPFRVFI